MKDGLEGLTPAERREAAFYRLKYLGYSFAFDYNLPTNLGVDVVIGESKAFLDASEEYSVKEATVAGVALLAFANASSSHDELEFVRWVKNKLETLPASLERDLFIARLERIAHRLELTSQVLVLKSTTIDDREFELESLQGKVVLIDFWSTRCVPCIKEQPALKRIYETYRARGFEIVGVCLNAEPARIKRFINDHNLPWIQICQDQTASQDCNKLLEERFGIEAVPTTLLIDANGKVIAQGIRPLHPQDDLDLERNLQELLPNTQVQAHH